MKPLAITLAAGLCLAAAAPPVLADAPVPQCINIAQIDHTQVLDDRTILFHLRRGQTLRNTLQANCVGLRMSNRGFTYVVQADQICGNLQSIRVNDTGAVCELGPFTPEPPKP